MTNKEISQFFKLMASILELHDANPFKVKGYQSGAYNLEKINTPLNGLSVEELQAIDGINKNTASKIYNLTQTGSFEELDQLLAETPSGVIELLEIPGIGPKKVRTIWKELGIENKKQLYKACQEDKIANLKGFGKKTQDTIIEGLLFAKEQEGKYLYAEIENYASSLLSKLQEVLPNNKINSTGQIIRKLEIIDCVQFLVETNDAKLVFAQLKTLDFLEQLDTSSPFIWRGKDKELSVDIEVKCYSKEYKKQVFLHSSGLNHLKATISGQSIRKHSRNHQFEDSSSFYTHIGFHDIPPESREGFAELGWTTDKPLPTLIENGHLRGVLHNHSLYSDGKNSIKEMAEACIERGYEYFGISDHSVTAFYANGLDDDRVFQQQAEIDQVNGELKNFTVFKGIESDILNDGSLDYSTDVLKSFDFIVASIHSNLKMDQNTATKRLIKAIENPYTTFLGHMTGRLLLKREGYPLNFPKIIDACADNKVIIEINANPRRLDIDWRWMNYALEKGVLLSINPDAHQISGIDDMKYGVNVARKAGVPKEMIFNTKTKEDVAAYFNSKQP